MTDLQTLIDDLSAAEVGSRELDYRVWCYISNFRWVSYADFNARMANRREGHDYPHYTTSIDAADSLRPASVVHFTIHAMPDEYGFYAHAYNSNDETVGSSLAPTEPLARTSAFLKAIQAEQEAG